MLRNKLLIAIPLSLILCAGCSGNKDLFAPVEAPEIDDVIDVDSVWSDSIGGSGKFFSTLTPAVSGKMIYAAGRNGDVYGIRSENGSKVWNTDLSDEEENDDKRSARLSGGVSVSGSKLAVGSENGYIYVLNTADGKIAWKNYIGSEITSIPTFSDSGQSLFVLDSLGRISAFDTMTGERRWMSGSSSGALRLRKQSSPVSLGDSYLLVGQSDGKVSVIDQLNGNILTEFTVGRKQGSNDLERVSDVAATPLVLGSDMYTTAYNNGFVEFSLKDKVMKSQLAYQSSRNIAYDTNFFVITGDNGHVYCISRGDYVEQWENSRLSYRNVSAPAIYGNYVVVGDMEGYVYFMRLSDGGIEAMLDTDGTAINVAPIVDGSNLLVYTTGGDLECFRYDPIGAASSKAALAKAEFETAGVGVSFSATDSGSYAMGMTSEQLQQRRAEANRIVSMIEAHERQVAAQKREYERRKAEYERQKAEYEKRVKEAEAERRQQVSGFGLMPGVKSDSSAE